MCGIVGQFGAWKGNADNWLMAAVNSLVHRGPDDGGTWTDSSAEIFLGHRRLSVVDTTVGGHQPFISTDGRWVLVFNGEIYNHRSLRSELAALGREFRTSSDTEVLLAAIESWGLTEALRKSNGMFAIALWDRSRRVLALARDRLGEKPLFLQRSGSSVRFASELKALRAGGQPEAEIDPSSLALYMRLGYVPSPHSIYKEVSKITPGTILWLGQSLDSVESYWELPPLGVGDVAEESTGQLSALLGDAVSLRMNADVPVGAFLSGGVDSSLVTALMAERSSSVKTFTIGFHEAEFDESLHASRVAEHLGTDHTVLHVSPEEARAVVPELPAIFDEPFADQSAIPTVLVSRLARASVTVCLSGDGGDELFGGYTRYRRIARAAPLSVLPASVGRLTSSAGIAIGARSKRFAGSARTLDRIGLGLRRSGSRGMYESLVSLWEDPATVVRGGDELPYILSEGRWPLGGDVVRHAMGADLKSYLPDDILVKVDRASMSVGLEARVPLLDHRIVEWSRLNGRPSVRRERQMKAPLKALLSNFVPEEIVERPKMGFGAPVGAWLRGPLREWADELLDPDELERDGLLIQGPIRARWEAHLSGSIDYSYPLWAVLCFQAWRRQWGG